VGTRDLLWWTMRTGSVRWEGGESCTVADATFSNWQRTSDVRGAQVAEGVPQTSTGRSGGMMGLPSGQAGVRGHDGSVETLSRYKITQTPVPTTRS